MTTDHQDRSTETIDLALRLLDHQITGTDGELLGNVDNAVIHILDGDWWVRGIVRGPAGYGPRLHGRPRRWVVAIWRRLRPEADPPTLVIGMEHVTRIGSDVQVNAWGQHLLDEQSTLENWLRVHVVSKIPGATGGDDRLHGEPVQTDLAQPATALNQVTDTDHLLSELLHAPVRAADGEDLGQVLEVSADAPQREQTAVGPLKVTSLTYGRSRVGAELGYTTDAHQGPLILAALFKRWHHNDGHVPIDDVADIDWNPPAVTLTRHAQPVHPHTARPPRRD